MPYDTTGGVKSFVQLHYHDRLGGVSKVMNYYREAARTAETLEKDLIICHAPDPSRGAFDPGTVISLRQADYHFFRSARAFYRVRDTLERQVKAILKDGNLPTPCVVVGHNLTLGKNPALSAAFSRIAKELGTSGEYRFFSVIHDFAEEGRVHLMHRLRRLEAQNTAIFDALYPGSETVTYVTLNERNRRVLTEAGFRAYLLPNPVEKPQAATRRDGRDTAHMSAALYQYARTRAGVFYPQRPTIFYPVRIITRKNIVEAVIVACLLFETNLVLGGYGTSTGDRAFARRLEKMCRMHALPLLCDVDGMKSSGAHADTVPDEPFAAMFSYARACITTSIAEGFGYALFEPWMHDTPLIGRVPLGMQQLHAGAWMPHLYTGLQIPVAWIDIQQLMNRYMEQLRRCFGTRGAFSRRDTFHRMFTRHVIDRDMIDLGYCDLQTQFALLSALAMDTHKRVRLRALNPALDTQQQLLTGNDSLRRETVSRVKRVIVHELFYDAFYRTFHRCFFETCPPAARPHTQHARRDPDMIQRYFSDIRHFRLLFMPSSG